MGKRYPIYSWRWQNLRFLRPLLIWQQLPNFVINVHILLLHSTKNIHTSWEYNKILQNFLPPITPSIYLIPCFGDFSRKRKIYFFKNEGKIQGGGSKWKDDTIFVETARESEVHQLQQFGIVFMLTFASSPHLNDLDWWSYLLIPKTNMITNYKFRDPNMFAQHFGHSFAQIAAECSKFHLKKLHLSHIFDKTFLTNLEPLQSGVHSSSEIGINGKIQWWGSLYSSGRRKWGTLCAFLKDIM